MTKGKSPKLNEQEAKVLQDVHRGRSLSAEQVQRISERRAK